MSKHKKTKLKKPVKIIIIIIALLLLAGGGVTVYLLTGGKPEDVKKIIPKPKEKEEEPVVQIVDLTKKTRPFAVMVNNINEARTVQSGLNNAYMVYELIAEGGITRYLALFRDQEGLTIGSVRSARHYYLDYVLENDAMYAHFGWSPQAQSDIRTLGIDNINGLTYDGSYYYRINTIGAPHNAFTSYDLLKEIAEIRGYSLETDAGVLLKYSAKPISLKKYETTLANTVEVDYSNYTHNTYKYDAETKLYTRYVNDEVQIDHNDETPITVKNIIIYQVNNYTIAGDEKGRQFLENIGTGDGFYVTDGVAVPITWEKKDRANKTIYKLADGTELTVNDGNTWIQIVPLEGYVGME